MTDITGSTRMRAHTRNTVIVDRLKDLGTVFRAAHIATPIQGADVVDCSEDAKEARRRLLDRRFDQAPVMQGAHVAGWIQTAKLRDGTKVKSALRPLQQTPVVSGDAPIGAVVRCLRHGFVFTAGDERIDGFIVPSDMDKHAVRGYFYLQISRIEMLLSEIVDERCTEFSIVRTLERTEVAERWREARREGREVRPVEYLYLKDLAELFLDLGAVSADARNRLTSNLHRLCHFRPRVMHPTRSLLGGMDVAQLASLAEAAESTIRAIDVTGHAADVDVK